MRVWSFVLEKRSRSKTGERDGWELSWEMQQLLSAVHAYLPLSRQAVTSFIRKQTHTFGVESRCSDVEIDTLCIYVVEWWIVQSYAYAQPTSLLISDFHMGSKMNVSVGGSSSQPCLALLLASFRASVCQVIHSCKESIDTTGS